MGKRGKLKKQRRAAVARARAGACPGGMTATLPDGTKVRVSGRSRRRWPPGTMLTWNERSSRGHPEMRWTVVGGGWPFDD